MHTLHLDVEDPEDLQVLLLRVTPPPYYPRLAASLNCCVLYLTHITDLFRVRYASCKIMW